MSERQIDIEAKIIALLELSESTAKGTEHEAKLALETAIRLAAKHGISMSKIAEKRKGFVSGDWFKGSFTVVEYTDARYAEISVKGWCDLAESFGWQRYRRSQDDREGLIFAHRQPFRDPKMEIRIFERPWHDVEFEVVKNPDPIIGNIDRYMKMGFDVIELGVTYTDFRDWLVKDDTGRVRVTETVKTED